MRLLGGNKRIPNGQFHLGRERKNGLWRINEPKDLCFQLDVKCKHTNLWYHHLTLMFNRVPIAITPEGKLTMSREEENIPSGRGAWEQKEEREKLKHSSNQEYIDRHNRKNNNTDSKGPPWSLMSKQSPPSEANWLPNYASKASTPHGEEDISIKAIGL